MIHLHKQLEKTLEHPSPFQLYKLKIGQSDAEFMQPNQTNLSTMIEKIVIAQNFVDSRCRNKDITKTQLLFHNCVNLGAKV
jgi:hypothetical protein